MQETQEKVDIVFDPSRDEVLGVFGENVHIQIDGLDDKYYVLIIPIEEYIRVWRNWLKGKKDYCERNNHYCGVMGYTFPENLKKMDEQISLNIWNQRLEDYNEVKADVYFCDKFEDRHDFEHG